MKNRIVCLMMLLLSVSSLMAQDALRVSFDDVKVSWKTVKGKVELLSQGAYQGKSMRLAPGTVVRFPLSFQSASRYVVAAYMRTESGADNMTMSVTGIGKNNVSVSTALASWTLCKQSFNVSAGQGGGDT